MNYSLEEPSLNRKNEAIEYIEEFIKNNSNISGTGNLDDYLEDRTYEIWLEEIKKLENKEYANSVGFVPATTYFMIREKDNKIIGMINLRHELNERLAKTGGHIGYSIRPLERKKGYAKIQLYLCLLKAREIGLEKVMLTCDEKNIASYKTMEALGGIFERKEFEKDRITKVYWIDVDESIKKYKYLIK
jgi:predicted acetyltransferase